jgi:NADH-quinone oxidoreductase subunit J
MRLTGWETVFFYALGGLALLTGLLVVTARSAVHSALALVSTLIAVAGLFVLLQAGLLAGVQVLVYVGGVMVLFLFVVALVHVGREERRDARVFNRQAGAAWVAAVVLGVFFVLAVNAASGVFARDPATLAPIPEVAGNTEQVGLDLYRRAALPFEIASVLLLVAIVGAVLLAREPDHERIND